MPTAEDYAWAIEQVKRGRVCRRLDLRFDYQHSGHDRTGEFAHIVFTFALRHRLRVAWLGVMRSVKQMLTRDLFPSARCPSAFLALRTSQSLG